jgi:cell division protein FtsB
MTLEQKVMAATIEAKKIKKTLNKWENRVALLHPSKIDPDMLEERVREMLNFGHINDVVFIIQDKNWNS